MVLAESASAYVNCFDGDADYASCTSYGYYMAENQSQGAYDCITCELGYEINVMFSDCTGFCVPEGTAVNPIDASGCMAHVQCVHDLYGDGGDGDESGDGDGEPRPRGRSFP